MGIYDAVKNGDELSALIAIRDNLADRLDNSEDDKAAPLAKQLRDTLQRIAQIAPDEDENTVPSQLRNRSRRKKAR